MHSIQTAESMSIADKLDPQTQQNGNYTGAVAIDMRNFGRLLVEIQYQSGDGNLDANLQSSPNANMNPTHNITNSNMTQITGAMSNKRQTIEITSDVLNKFNSGDRFVRLNTNVSSVINTGVTYGATVWGLEPTHAPAKTQDVAGVSQRLVVS